MPRSSKKKPLTLSQRIAAKMKQPYYAVKAFSKDLLSRRPHRSFRLTRRRDYTRSLELPGYISFTVSVNKVIWKYKKTMVGLVIVYAILTLVLIGIGSQETYTTLNETLQETGSEVFSGNIGQLGQAALLFASIGSSGLTAAPGETQQVYMVLVGLLIWLTTIWLLRNLIAGHKVKLRDGLYNAGSPILATFLITIVMALQLIPVALAIIAYTSAQATGLLAGGVATMLFWVAAILLAVISLYWITSTFFAMVIATLPGMYPMKALRTAGDMVVGRRVRILLRILWMILVISITGALILIPTILITTGLTNLWPAVGSVPIVPFVLMLFSVCTFIWSASYIYLLYRKVVDDDASPA